MGRWLSSETGLNKRQEDSQMEEDESFVVESQNRKLSSSFSSSTQVKLAAFRLPV